MKNCAFGHPSATQFAAQVAEKLGGIVIRLMHLSEHVSTANPTLLNGRPVTQRKRLVHGDVIDLGQGALRLRVSIR